MYRLGDSTGSNIRGSGAYRCVPLLGIARARHGTGTRVSRQMRPLLRRLQVTCRSVWVTTFTYWDRVHHGRFVEIDDTSTYYFRKGRPIGIRILLTGDGHSHPYDYVNRGDYKRPLLSEMSKTPRPWVPLPSDRFQHLALDPFYGTFDQRHWNEDLGAVIHETRTGRWECRQNFQMTFDYFSCTFLRDVGFLRRPSLSNGGASSIVKH